MSELVKVQAGFAKAQTVDGVITSFNENTLIHTGRTRLRSVMLMDTSNGATVGVGSYCSLLDGVDSSGTEKLRLYPNLVGILGAALLNSKALFVELPGSGILFDDGIYCKMVGGTLDTAGIKSMAVTVLYG